MSWQQETVSEITFDHNERPLGPEKDKTAEDSSILRYIKTLTNHQMNAKQQRMDRYLQQVKHVQSAEDFSVRLSKSPQYPLVTRNQHQQLQKRSKTKVKSKRNDRVRNDQQHVAAATNHSCSRSKRPNDNNHEDRQTKKPKKSNQQTKQTTIIGSLERFRLHGAWSQKAAGNHCEDGSKMPPDVTGNKPVQSVQIQDLTRMPQTLSSKFSTMRTDLDRRSVQELRPLLVKAHAGSVPPQDPCSNFAQPINFLSPEEAQPRNLDCVFPQQEAFIPTYDPLTSVMESIYF
ncbi:unnamed protein product [Peronospora farinosa]|uniref:Uncharacterized protein n=1 Tax=Peronospora farinosa TaxID=134698 RepID=A0AAV0U521_9STRA|nr:unnamed protein product [Peronospora farinosa]CAI5732077.1 unnamed protein product [Peronospora farinosa]